MTKEKMIADLNASTESLLAALSRFDPPMFLSKPSPGGWSAAGIAEHLVKIDAMVSGVLRGETAPTTRAPTEKLALLKTRMEGTDKRVAADAMSPAGKAIDKDAVLAQLKEQRAALKNSIETLDETATCLNYVHPALGELTRTEWIYFVIHHTERHLRQLAALPGKTVAQP